MADSHAALFGQGCTEVGMATYGTGSSVMAPVADLSAGDARIPVTLAWVIDGSPTYALEGTSCPRAPRWRGRRTFSPMVASLILWPLPTRCPTVAASLWCQPSPVWVPPLGPERACAHLRHERGNWSCPPCTCCR